MATDVDLKKLNPVTIRVAPEQFRKFKALLDQPQEEDDVTRPMRFSRLLDKDSPFAD